MEDMIFYNKHYITVDERGRIVNGFSDAFRQPSDTDICINEQGGYQFRLPYMMYDPDFELSWHHVISEENPPLYELEHMIPLYKYDAGMVKRRTPEEIDTDIAALPVPESTPTQLDRVEAQVTYTAMMTDTLLMEV